MPVACRRCHERTPRDEPCRCVRQRLRGGSVARGDRATPACADGQHYACCGYLPYGREWRRCLCTCHPEVTTGDVAA